MTLGQNSPGKDLKVRYLYLGAAMLLGLLVLSVRLYRLQVTRGDEFKAKSVENFVKEVRIPADRGLILDTTGRILVDSRPSFDVYVTPAFCAKCKEDVLPRLATWFGWEQTQIDEIYRLISKARRDAPFRPVPIRIDVSREQAEVLDAHLTELPGVEVMAVPHRNYRSGAILSHALGYMNEITQEELERLNARGASYALGDYIGRRGLEKAFENLLRGTDGHRKQVVDARGKSIPGLTDLVGADKVVQPVAGNNVVLSLDMRLQEEADRAFPGTAGTVIAIDVRTGFILAMLSRPGYDPNLLTGRITGQQMSELARDPLKPMMNRATQMHYSPGSTFKVVTALAALREKIFTPHSHVNCPGGYRLGSRVWRCHKDSGHGMVDARTALQKSCDTYYYRAADLMGIEPIAREARELGLGAPTGIAGLIEEPGIMPDTAYHDRVTPGGYQKGMALNTAIGQGDVNTTPLQLVMMYSAIANGGKLHRPQLVRSVISRDGKVVKTYEPEVVRTVEMPPDHRQVVIDALTMVVNQAGGTAYSKRLKDVVVAGKTGTAQVARLGEKRLKTEQMDYWVRDHAWFAAFAPADNPEIAIVVLNEHGGHGGSDAAPTAMAVLRKYFDLKKEAQDTPVAVMTPETVDLAEVQELANRGVLPAAIAPSALQEPPAPVQRPLPAVRAPDPAVVAPAVKKQQVAPRPPSAPEPAPGSEPEAQPKPKPAPVAPAAPVAEDSATESFPPRTHAAAADSASAPPPSAPAVAKPAASRPAPLQPSVAAPSAAAPVVPAPASPPAAAAPVAPSAPDADENPDAAPSAPAGAP